MTSNRDDLTAASAALTAQVDGLRPQWADQPRTVQAYLDRCLKKINLGSTASLQKLVEAAAVMDAVGCRALLPLGAAMASVPFTGNYTLYEPARTTVCLAYRRATLDGSAEAERLQQLLAIPEGGVAGAVGQQAVQLRLNGGLLRTPPGAADFVTGKQIIPSRAGQIHELAFMWALGGSASWPRPRLDEQIENYAAEVAALFT